MQNESGIYYSIWIKFADLTVDEFNTILISFVIEIKIKKHEKIKIAVILIQLNHKASEFNIINQKNPNLIINYKTQPRGIQT